MTVKKDVKEKAAPPVKLDLEPSSDGKERHAFVYGVPQELKPAMEAALNKVLGVMAPEGKNDNLITGEESVVGKGVVTSLQPDGLYRISVVEGRMALESGRFVAATVQSLTEPKATHARDTFHLLSVNNELSE